MSESSSSEIKEQRDMRSIKRRVDRIGLRDLGETRLRGMVEELDQEKAEVESEAAALEQELVATLHNGNARCIAELKKDIRKLSHDYDALEVERDILWNNLQQRILDDRMAAALGSRLRAHVLEGVIVTLIFGVISLLLWSMLDNSLSLETRRTLFWIDTGCCMIFLTDFAFRWRLAESKSWYWRRYWVDFVTSIPIPDGQVLRLGRFARLMQLARLARIARLLRVLRLVFFFLRGMEKLEDVLHVRLMKRSLMFGLVILLLGAALIYWAEGGAQRRASPETPTQTQTTTTVVVAPGPATAPDNAGVQSFGESVWWSFTTVVTGGFGDIHNPQSTTGRLLTVILVIAGMVVVGIFTATLTSVLVGDESEEIESMQKKIGGQLVDVSQRLEDLATKVDQLKNDDHQSS